AIVAPVSPGGAIVAPVSPGGAIVAPVRPGLASVALARPGLASVALARPGLASVAPVRPGGPSVTAPVDSEDSGGDSRQNRRPFGLTADRGRRDGFLPGPTPRVGVFYLKSLSENVTRPVPWGELSP
ncbi:MAG: hypothetical protein KJ621_02495, partial [Proteobacteria bacterium]|nr:hypothetical protein [Pseudomonadota bacterium]